MLKIYQKQYKSELVNSPNYTYEVLDRELYEPVRPYQSGKENEENECRSFKRPCQSDTQLSLPSQSRSWDRWYEVFGLVWQAVMKKKTTVNDKNRIQKKAFNGRLLLEKSDNCQKKSNNYQGKSNLGANVNVNQEGKNLLYLVYRYQPKVKAAWFDENLAYRQRVDITNIFNLLAWQASRQFSWNLKIENFLKKSMKTLNFGLLTDFALTPLQVKQLYNEGASVRFGPSTGSP